MEVQDHGHYHIVSVELKDGVVARYQVKSKSVKEAQEKVKEFMGSISYNITDIHRLGSVNILQ